MNGRTRVLLTCAIGVSILAAGSLAANAADQPMPVKAVPVEEGWWFKAYVEVGGRDFVNDPNRGGIKTQGTGNSLAGFYEYRDLRPGPFANGWFATGTKDGLWEIDVHAKNVGYNDQAYELNWSKAGEHYFTFDWDQTPHVYSTSALTIFNGVGTNALTLPPGLSQLLFNAAGCVAHANAAPTGCGATPTAAQAANIQSIINSNLHQTDIGIRRDTGSVEYRFTPTDAWDVRVNYSNMHRFGTQVDGVNFTNTAGGVVAQVPKPVDDVTQNYGASGEYLGTSPWNQKYNIKVAYSGSTYTDKSDSYTVQNPFCGAVGFCAQSTNPSAPLALMSLPPSNSANGASATVGVDLPWKSRYMGTYSYTGMRQNDAFLPFTASSQVFTVGTATVGAPPAVPFGSLNGQINEVLINNVLTTQVTPTLKNKFSYRYYDFDNGTPQLTFAQWVVNDVQLASVTSTSFTPVTALSMGYTKQNAGDEIVWNPTRQWNVGFAYGFERYDWMRESANATEENSAKLFADWKATTDVTVRGSWLAAQRIYNNYDYVDNLGAIQWSGLGTAGSLATRTVSAMREFYLNNRDRNKAQLSVDWEALPRLTITPTAGLLYDDYSVDPASQVGLTHSREWRAGIEANYVVAPDTTLLFSYMYEHYNQFLIGTTATGTANPFASTSEYLANVSDSIHTVAAWVNYAAIPDKLTFKFGYTVAFSLDDQSNDNFINGAGPGGSATAPGVPYPTVKNIWQRFDAIAKYKLDPAWVHSMGWKGDVYTKLQYAWERNSMSNWAVDEMNNYMFNVSSSTGYMTWLAYDNPNYSVQMVMASVALSW